MAGEGGCHGGTVVQSWSLLWRKCLPLGTPKMWGVWKLPCPSQQTPLCPCECERKGFFCGLGLPLLHPPTPIPNTNLCGGAAGRLGWFAHFSVCVCVNTTLTVRPPLPQFLTTREIAHETGEGHRVLGAPPGGGGGGDTAPSSWCQNPVLRGGGSAAPWVSQSLLAPTQNGRCRWSSDLASLGCNPWRQAFSVPPPRQAAAHPSLGKGLCVGSFPCVVA